MERTMTITGTGTVQVQPDLTVLSLTLNAKDRDYARMSQNAAAQADALREAVRRAGFAPDALKTASFRVDTEYEHVPDENGVYQQRFAGYACVHSLLLEMPADQALLSSVLGEIGNAAVTPELNIRFTVKEPEQYRAEALERAAQSAKERAQVLAAASGVQLKALVNVVCGEHPAADVPAAEYQLMRAAKAVGNGLADCAASVTPDAIRMTETAVFTWQIG